MTRIHTLHILSVRQRVVHRAITPLMVFNYALAPAPASGLATVQHCFGLVSHWRSTLLTFSLKLGGRRRFSEGKIKSVLNGLTGFTGGWRQVVITRFDTIDLSESLALIPVLSTAHTRFEKIYNLHGLQTVNRLPECSTQGSWIFVRWSCLIHETGGNLKKRY